jgi:hypothetical protein
VVRSAAQGSANGAGRSDIRDSIRTTFPSSSPPTGGAPPSTRSDNLRHGRLPHIDDRRTGKVVSRDLGAHGRLPRCPRLPSFARRAPRAAARPAPRSVPSRSGAPENDGGRRGSRANASCLRSCFLLLGTPRKARPSWPGFCLRSSPGRGRANAWPGAALVHRHLGSRRLRDGRGLCRRIARPFECCGAAASTPRVARSSVMTDSVRRTLEHHANCRPAGRRRQAIMAMPPRRPFGSKPVGRMPRAVVHCQNSRRRAVGFPGRPRLGLSLSVRSGGHDWAG